jgi:hypothetical protein
MDVDREGIGRRPSVPRAGLIEVGGVVHIPCAGRTAARASNECMRRYISKN